MKQTGTKKRLESKFDFEAHPSKIREARVASKLSQDEVALKLDYAHTTYGEIERGRRPVRAETALRLANLLDKRIIDLFEQLKNSKKWVARRSA